ncbi:heparan-alpha-glucosaminide N-acetyltransferase [Tropicimonas sp. IMCC6043]|uniref:heparan-alpha-glucosaminide N-acetyltransferase n=1 Tax=Tropicimonas sp. IMCC6043 TaxID=2510645 RepID=UPI00101D9BFA|nr:heparan-alpha-glucosaminide N-acetyltransferase [Tropicimonas sp. IMCC6043]RYH06413.1 DUF1624 domain-containing protein [Tropicimonas sp. IMCC6043]
MLEPSQRREAVAIAQNDPLPGRIVAVDIGRGVAIIGMVIFHFVFDLEFLGILPRGTTLSGPWAIFARTVAGSFLFFAGVSLVLAHRSGIKWRSFLRRSAVIALAALAVSVGTFAFAPNAFVYFGILHAITVARFAGLAFLRLPSGITAAVAGLVFVLPHYVQSAAFDTRWLAWIGFSLNRPLALDFEPVFPWLAPCLLGIAATRVALRKGVLHRLARRGRSAGPLARALGWAGRNSLVIYLLHQLLMLPLLWGIVSLARAS